MQTNCEIQLGWLFFRVQILDVLNEKSALLAELVVLNELYRNFVVKFELQNFYELTCFSIKVFLEI